MKDWQAIAEGVAERAVRHMQIIAGGSAGKWLVVIDRAEPGIEDDTIFSTDVGEFGTEGDARVHARRIRQHLSEIIAAVLRREAEEATP